MARALKKQSHLDFRSRIKRVDPRFFRMGNHAYARDTTPRRGTLSMLTGFGWIYLAASIANNRDHIAASLRQGSLPAEYHPYIFGVLTAMLAASTVMVLLHLMRYLFNDGNKKRNSGGILLGGLGALMLFYTPADVWNQGFGMLDGHSQNMLQHAGAAIEEAFPGVRIDDVAFVTSGGN